MQEINLKSREIIGNQGNQVEIKEIIGNQVEIVEITRNH